MKKKVLLILLAALMLTGCGKNESNSGEKETTTEKETPSPIVNEDGTVNLDKIEAGLSDDFYYGVDISTLIAQEESGVKYYNEDGKEEDLIKILADNGTNMVRIRVWNDPYDENKNGYGGGNCDVDTAIAIGKRATENGMSCLINFHYSDFWADPSKQMCPKAWKGMGVDEKCTALYEYTKESMKKILDAGVNVSMVQVGNETTTGMAGEKDWFAITKLMSSGCKAIREVSEEYKKDIEIAIHFTNPEKKGAYAKFAKTLDHNKVDYDVFATSYYPFWHGTLDNLETVLGDVIKNYGKKVLVTEISYAHSMDDGDGHQNTIYPEAWGEFVYELSVDSQIKAVKDCVNQLKVYGDYFIGICYWEPAWIPVPGDDVEMRSALWEKYGSGWASSFASGYDSKDAGQYYGGSAWDNQAWFDFTGKPLASLNTYEEIQKEN